MQVLTQNIDGLHQRAGLEDRKALELHGTMRTTTCTRRRTTMPTQRARDRRQRGSPGRTSVTFALGLQPTGLMRLMSGMVARTMRSGVAQLSALKADLAKTN